MGSPDRAGSLKSLIRAARDDARRERLSESAAALAFYGILSLFPFLLFLVSLVSVLISPAQLQLLIDEVERVAPKEATDILSSQLRRFGQSSDVGLLTLGAAGALWAASKGIVAIIRALNEVHEVEESRPAWKVRLMGLSMTIILGVLGLFSALLAVVTPVVAAKVPHAIGEVVLWLRMPAAVVLMMVVWSLTYYVLPCVKQRFRLITPGSLMGVLVWAVASWVFSTYVVNFGHYNVTYGALGGVIVLLLWIWLSAVVLLAGAETNVLLERRARRTGAKGFGLRALFKGQQPREA